jgi:hypothetical protein
MSRSCLLCCRFLLPGVLVLGGVLSASSDEPTADERVVIMRLTTALKDEDPLVRKRAAVGLSRLGPKARSAIPALEAVLTDRDAQVRAAAASALEAIDPTGAGKPKDPEKKEQPKVEGPNPQRKAVGRFEAQQGEPAILLARPPDATEWQRVQPGAVSSADTLVCLPGYAAQLHVNGGRILLRGHLLEYARHPLNQLLLESAVTLHQPPDGCDVDLTLRRGRVFLSNSRAKDTLTVRLRLLEDIWDLVLEPGAEVGVTLLRNYVTGQNWNTEEPLSEVYLLVLRGRVEMHIDSRKFPMEAPPGLAAFGWTSIDGRYQGPDPVRDQAIAPTLEAWSKTPPSTDAVKALNPALKELSALMAGNKNPLIVLSEELGSDRPEHRRLAICALGAVDQVPKLLDVLNDADPAHAAERELAVHVLRRWLNRGLEQNAKLYDAKNPDRGILRDRRYTQREAQTIVTLLHNFSEQDSRQPETFALLIREPGERQADHPRAELLAAAAPVPEAASRTGAETAGVQLGLERGAAPCRHRCLPQTARRRCAAAQGMTGHVAFAGHNAGSNPPGRSAGTGRRCTRHRHALGSRIARSVRRYRLRPG